MARSNLLGGDPVDVEPAGRNNAALGPSDSSDSGSDVTGTVAANDDPSMAVDHAMRDDRPRRLDPDGVLASDATRDASGTGERSSAAGAGVREAGDISVDRVFSPGSTQTIHDVDGLSLGDDHG